MKRILTLLLNIGEEMLLSGAEVSRAEESINKMGYAFGATRVDAFIITSSLVVTVHNAQGEAFTQTRRVRHIGTDIERLHRLNKLSRDICSGLCYEDAEAAFEKIKNTKSYPFLFHLFAYGFISAAFALFFGGGAIDSVCSFFIGIVLSLVGALTEKRDLNAIFARFLSAFSATLLAFIAVKLGILDSADFVIIGNIMLLIPGVGITVALRDMFVGDSLSGIIRTIEALLLAFSIALGYFFSAFLMHNATDATLIADPNPILQTITGCIGSTGFAILYNIRNKRLLFAAVGGLLSWALFLLLGFAINDEIVRYLIVSAFISIYAEIMARAMKTPKTTFIIISLIPLIPGSALYYTMRAAFSGDVLTFAEKGVQTLGYAGALAAGIIVVAGIMKLLRFEKRNNKRL